MPPANEEFPSRDLPMALPATEGAAYWLAVLSDENCSDAERQQFFEWLRSSTHNVDEFLRLSTLTRRARQPQLWPAANVETLIAAAQASGNVAAIETINRGHSSRTERRSFARFPAWAIAASLVCIVALSAVVLMTTRLAELYTPSYRTEVGEQRSITLEDGSVVELNSQSRLRTDFTESLRAVELLEGEAIFRVAKEAARPFRVRTGATDIVALGTAFNVNANEARTIVTVLEGRVRVNKRIDTTPVVAARVGGEVENIELTIGEQVIVARTRPLVRLVLRDTEKVTSWTQRRLIFDDTTIAAAAAEFARYSPRRIRIENEQLGARRITGVFDATDPASLVEFLATDASVEVRASGDGWIVNGK